MAYLTTDPDGDILTTESGQSLIVNVPTSNGDIQQFDFDVNLLQAIVWQYTSAVNLQSLLQSKQNWYNCNQTAFWENWIQNVFNLPTANEFGLNVWSIILGLPLFTNVPPWPDKPTFGFDLAAYGNFDNSNFTDTNGISYDLPDSLKKIALQLRYFQLITSGTVPEINRFLKYLFGQIGTVYLLDYGNMTQAYIFDFPVNSDLAYLFNNYDILPRPAGVSSSWVDATLSYFGFGPYGLNFDNGIFAG